MRRYLTRVFRLTGRATGVQQANQRSVTSAPVNITVKPPSGEPQVEPLMGWGGETLGAWGHPTIDPVILKVTTLSNDMNEEGSLFWALNQNYPRIIVFEVGGIIDMEWKKFYSWNKDGEFDINFPYVTVAGQTAPSPGITIIRGGLDFWAHNAILQHISIIPGEHPDPTAPGQFGNRRPGIRIIDESSNHIIDRYVVIDHCSFAQATQYHIGLFVPAIEDRSDYLGKVTISNCILAEGMTSTDGTDRVGQAGLFSAHDLVVVKNLWSYNRHRNPHLVDSKGIYANNFIRAWSGTCTFGDGWAGANMTFIGNYGIHKDFLPGTSFPNRGLYQHRGSQDGHMYFDDNISLDEDGESPLPIWSMTGGGDIIFLEEPPHWHASLDGKIVPAAELQAYLEDNVGARPWARTPFDQRIIEEAIAGTGKHWYGIPGDWVLKNYQVNDHVNYEDGGVEYTYRCHTSTTNQQPPTNNSFWERLWPSSENWSPDEYPDYEPTHRYYNSDEWEWHDGKQGLTDEKRVLINKATGSYAHPDDL